MTGGEVVYLLFTVFFFFFLLVCDFCVQKTLKTNNNLCTRVKTNISFVASSGKSPDTANMKWMFKEDHSLGKSAG